MVQICQKEHSNHTLVIVLELTGSVLVLQPRLAVQLLNAAALRVAQSSQLNNGNTAKERGVFKLTITVRYNDIKYDSIYKPFSWSQ